MQRSIRRLVSAVATFALALAIAAPAAAADNAMVRVIHASPDAPNVDVWVDGTKVLTDVPYMAVSSYLSVPPGAHNVQVTPTGSTTPVIDANLTLDPGVAYSVAAINPVATIAAVVLTDDLTTVAGKAKLRVFHASSNAPASVDVALAGGAVLVPGLAYGTASGYLTVDPGSYDLEVRAAGSTTAALTLTATLAAGQNVTAIAFDQGEGVVVVPTVDAQAMANTSSVPAGQSPVAILGLALLGLAVIFGTRRHAIDRAAR
jgi:Domain of unknown function (DUF4397)